MVGFLWLVLWRERWRWLGVVPILLALPLAAQTVQPEIIINGDGTAAERIAAILAEPSAVSSSA